MLTPQQQVNALIDHCWRQLLQLHKSLAELEKFNPDGWRKRAEEARALASNASSSKITAIWLPLRRCRRRSGHDLSLTFSPTSIYNKANNDWLRVNTQTRQRR
jgi:hypothetical protein